MDFTFNDLTPELFPLDFRYLVAPFWAAVDIQGGMGDISYQTYSSGSPLLDIVNTFINDEKDFSFNGRWMLLAEWNGVPSFFNPTNEVVYGMITSIFDKKSVCGSCSNGKK